MKFSFTLIWNGIPTIPDKQKACRSKIRNVSKGHSSSLPPLRFWWKKWINHSTSKGGEKTWEFPFCCLRPLTLSSLGPETYPKGAFGKRNCSYSAQPNAPSYRGGGLCNSLSAWAERSRHYRETAQGFKLGGVSGSMCHMLRLCPPSQLYQ